MQRPGLRLSPVPARGRLRLAADVDRPLPDQRRGASRSATQSRRAGVLFAFRAACGRRRGEIARLITAEHGKVSSDAAARWRAVSRSSSSPAASPHLLKGEFSETVSTRSTSPPSGSRSAWCAGITPFNFPAMVPMWIFPIAIACGNTFVLKPSREGSIRIGAARLAAGPRQACRTACSTWCTATRWRSTPSCNHETIKAVSFVGSTPIARYVYENGTKAGKRVQALGGAKNHMVVLPGRRPRPGRRRRDLGRVRLGRGALHGGLRAGGRRPRRRRAGNQASPRRVANLRVGPGTDERSEMGPLVTGPHRDKVASYLDSGVREGATLAVDGRVHPVIGGGQKRGLLARPQRPGPRDPGR